MSLPPPESDYWNTVPLRDAYMAWRLEMVSVERVENAPLFEREEPIRSSFPAWDALKKQIKPGDELWTFDSPKNFWSRGKGWCGLVLVRHGEFVSACVILMN